MTFRPQPKPHTPRSRSHLAFVRTLACRWCKKPGPSEASHHGTHGMALKSSDYRAIPLCGPNGCHAHHGAHFTLPGSSMSPEDTRAWFTEQALEVCAMRLEDEKRVPVGRRQGPRQGSYSARKEQKR